MYFNVSDWYWEKKNGSTVYSTFHSCEMNINDERYLAWVALGNTATTYPVDTDGNESRAELASVLKPYGLYVYPMTIDELVAHFDKKVQERLEDFAQQLYESFDRGVSYINSVIPEWAIEAKYLSQARDQTWMAAYNFMNEVVPQIAAGERQPPTWEEVEAILPPLAWPEGSRGYVEERSRAV